MPAPLDLDEVGGWEAVKVLAMAVGVREAARRMNLPEATVQARSAREGWMQDIPRSQPLPPTMRQTATGATKPSVAYAEILKEDNRETRLDHSRAARKVARHVANLEPEEVLQIMPSVLQNIKGAALVHGWSTGNNGQPSVRLDLIANSGGTALRLEMGGSVESEEDEE